MGGEKKAKRGWSKLTRQQMLAIMSSRTTCVYCGISFGDDFYSKKTRDRKDSAKGYEFDNVVLSCYRCNMIKSDALTYEDMLELGPIIRERIEKRQVRKRNTGD